MRQLNGQTFYSPSDLTEFHDSPFGSWCKLCYAATDGAYPEPDPEDAFLKMLQQAGIEHENWLVNELREQGRQVVDVTELCPGKDFLKQHETTVRLMQEGTEVIVQAALMDDEFAGFADFVVRIDKPSVLGDYSYEVWDTKLSKTVKVTHLLQLLAYARMIERIQGELPETVTVVLGSREFDRYPTAEYLPYFEATREKFLAAVSNFDQEAMPDPFESKNYGNWSTFAEALLAERRHLSLVANIRRSQIVKLNAAGVHTIDKLANLDDLSQVKIPNATLEKLREQAQVQIATEQQGSPQYRLRSPKANEPQLFSMLEPFSPGDIYFDLEGNPLAEGGLEFLWGMTVVDENREQEFIAYWAHNQAEEKLALAQFFELTLARWQRYPNMRVYHYAPYEMTALKRLVARYGIYENELDKMLREGLFVDLYRVVKNSLIIGQPSYSIKKVELMYRGGRATEIGLGGDAVVAYQQWTELGDQKTLDDIKLYNKDDCDSTYELAEWLRELKQKHHDELQVEAAQVYIEPPETPKNSGNVEKKQELSARKLRLRERLEKLTNEQSDTEKRHAIETLMHAINYYEREKKPAWWPVFEARITPDEELIDDRSVIVGCRLIERNGKYVQLQYAPEQEIALKVGETYQMKTSDDSAMLEMTLKAVDVDGGILEFHLVKAQYVIDVPHEFSLIAKPKEFSRDHFENALCDFADSVLAQKTLPSSLITELLLRNPPRFSGQINTITANHSGQADKLEVIIKLVEALDESFLTIQGPPGTGKTYTASRLIGHLLGTQPRSNIGIVSNSHTAANNLLRSAVTHCQSNAIECKALTGRTDDQLEALGVKKINNADVAHYLTGGVVAANSSFLFVRPELEGALDYLFIDEAGQLSIVDVIAMARSARNIVLLGDQMQLGQPTQATHPGDSGLSVLDYLMKHEQVVPEDKGVLLNRSYRMHQDVLDFISNMVYRGRLEADEANQNQRIDVTHTEMVRKQSGIEFHPVEHDGNTVSSDEEADYIQQLYQHLLHGSFTDKSGIQQPITTDDILIVTPYNLQVQRLKDRLPKARIGTVDKFQGQEAPVVIFSFCSSSPEESPRGLDFLFDLRRINVAVSRAQALAIVVGSPRLLEVTATSIPLMKKASLVKELGRVGR
jgi:uncharacterized protein